MVIVTRLNGPAFAVNPDLIERAESTPDTVLTLVDGTKYVIAESLGELIGLVKEFRASVIATAHELEQAPPAPAPEASAAGGWLTVVELPPRER